MFRLRSLSTLALAVSTLGAVACSGAKPTELDDSRGPIPEIDLGAQPDPGPSVPGDQGNQGNGNQGGDKGKDNGGKNNGGKDTPKDDFACDDSGVALTSTDPFDAAKSLGLCKKIVPGVTGWGVVSAKLVRPDGSTGAISPESIGLLKKLGAATPPSGKTMLAISTGTARAPGDPGYVAPSSGKDKGYSHSAPANVARVSSLCPADTTMGSPHDGVALELQLRTPADAKSLSFSHQLFSSDYGNDICTAYTDVFAVTMTPHPAGRTDDNIVFDANGDLVSINSPSTMRACTAGSWNGLTYACPLGTSPLTGTGFEGKAATGWLRTSVPVTGDTVVTLRFMVWDAGDGTYDSTVLLDELTFSTATSVTKTVPR